MACYQRVALESRGWDQADFVFRQMRADLRRFQILAADCQERGPTGLRNVIENVVFWRQGDFLLYVRRRADRTPVNRMSYWGREPIHW